MEIWDGFSDWENVKKEFECDEPLPEKVYLARYDGYGYEGDATVIYRNGSKYYINEGGHCSCYGLEGQWSPEEYGTKEIFLDCLRKRDPWPEDKKKLFNEIINQIENE